ncbi:PUA-like domain-containing protein [Blyttiomyces helicus]|uniref:PUA-like domain-containing protein n=1 Tax=Blyttiomyces helicus TaxID=388810 RepID=A0A4P9W963_9FUNG|nr:PUA-like domain-containing protein [Blyttiomyces helicus]|eukprot:RKO87330.1 PUA-like domain-containing protein [Blyttiomyces helicus]
MICYSNRSFELLQPAEVWQLAETTRIRHWLIKAEPDSRLTNGVDVKFSIDDLAAKGTSSWDGVRNYQARNIMRDQMKLGDQCFFYHSNTKMPGIVGIAEVCRESYPDFTAFDPAHPYYDPKSDAANPKWMMVDVKFIRKFNRLIPLKELQSHPQLSEMALVRQGRLSVQPVRDNEWDFVVGLEEKGAEDIIEEQQFLPDAKGFRVDRDQHQK